VSAQELAAESRADTEAFDCGGCDAECWDRSNRIGLGLRRALREAEVQAFTFNFADFDSRIGTPTVPFLEASKAMARGMGYAGEGDAVTATLVAALNCCYGPTTFTEMFCPDWEGGRIFMSHMGELNPALARSRPRLMEKRYGFGAVENPAVLVFPLRPGPAALVNLAPCREERMALIAADVEVLDTELEPGIPDSPHFWLAPPNRDTADFLRRYSEAGGTHHLALTPGAQAADFADLAAMKGWRFAAIA
jgi:L-arabinose isomerase